MWKAVSDSIRIIPELIRELPPRAKPAAAAGVISAILLIIIGLLRFVLAWSAQKPLLGAMDAVLYVLLGVVAVCIILVLIGVVVQFFQRP